MKNKWDRITACNSVGKHLFLSRSNDLENTDKKISCRHRI